MNRDRANRILVNLPRMASRVFQAVPMQEFWTVGQIVAEMARNDPHNLNTSEVSFALRTLDDAGLIREGSTRMTFRSNVKPPAIKPKTENNPEMANPDIKSTTPPSEKIMALGGKLREIADEMDNLAMEVEEAIQSAGAKNEKLLKLQSSLRELIGE